MKGKRLVDVYIRQKQKGKGGFKTGKLSSSLDQERINELKK